MTYQPRVVLSLSKSWGGLAGGNLKDDECRRQASLYYCIKDTPKAEIRVSAVEELGNVACRIGEALP